jgi:DNA-binding MarR family transcriptional regulator
MRAERKRPVPPDATRDPEAALSIGGLENHLGYFLRRLQVWVFQDFMATLSAMNVRPAQYSVLLVIAANPGQSQSAVGRTLNIERARLARMLHDLEERRWISRLASGRDARSHALVLTAEGEKALAKITALARKHETQLAGHIGEKRWAELMKLLRDFG